jgi:DNA-binding NarL/FixJ family response regulator
VTVGKRFTLKEKLKWSFLERSANGGLHLCKVRVLLADDHQEVIARVCDTLSEEFEIVGTVENGNQTVSTVLMLDPDILVTDISMPFLDGLEAARRIQKVNRHAKIIFLTIHEDPDFLAAAFEAGASGYVTKPRLSLDLIPAIHEVLKGRTFVSKSTVV